MIFKSIQMLARGVLCCLSNMFGAIAKIFKRKPEPASVPARSTKPSAQPALSRSSATVPKGETRPLAGAKSIPMAPLVAVTPTVPAGASRDMIGIPYASIIRCVPQDLWGKLAPAGAGAAQFVLSRSQVLEQLPQGTVKVSFAELRHHGPAGLFANNASQENRLIDLPLSDILAQLHPDSFARRPNQARIEVSEELPDLFGVRGERIAPVRVMDKQEAAASAAATRQNTPPPRNVVPVAPESFQTPPPALARQVSVSPPAAPPPPAAQRAATPAPSNPFKPAASLSTQSSPASRPAPALVNPLPKAPVSTKAPVSAAAPAAKPLSNVTLAKPAAAPTSAVPVAGSDAFLIPIDAVAAAWPEEIRQELACMKVPGARLAVPAADICDGLKRHLVQFSWRNLRAWIQPQPAAVGASPFDDVVLELPLKTITPLFLDHIRSSSAQSQVADYATITEFFRRKEQSPAPIAAPAALRPAAPPAPAPAPAFAAAPALAAGTVDLSLAHLSSSWPDPVKHDIAQFNLGQSTISIPVEYVDAGLKTGKLEFSWRQICAWLKPESPSSQFSINGEVRVAFPLSLVAPLFIKRTAGAQTKRKAHVDEEIPDIFSAGGLMPQPAAAPAAPAARVVPVAPVAVEAAPAPSAPAPTSGAPKPTARSLGELFNDPDKRSWTPNDIVHRAAQLPGVAGALIALQDGLLVAACMPPTARTETIAAFVPQIFGRMSQYTRELQLGETRGVSFTVESGTLQVFNAGIIYFAALGKPGALLPIPELQIIATELSRHTK